MAKGKQTCKILKEIRKQIAEENDINLVIEECTYKGDCLGTCPRCEAEVRYLERELEKRQRLGKVAVVAGMSLSTMFAAASCDSTKTMTDKGSLRGEVAAVDPVDPKDSRDSIPETLMGIVPMYNPVLLHMESVSPEVEAKMVFPESKKLTVKGYELQIPESLYSNYRENKEPYLVEKATRIAAPHFLGGEPALLQFLEEQLGEYARKGSREMEVEFTVIVSGRVVDVEVVRGIDEELDNLVTRIFKMMEWEPGVWEMESGEQIMISCSCTQKIYFPLKQ